MYRKGLIIVLLIMCVFLLNAVGLTSGYNLPRVGEVLEYKVTVKSMVHGANQTVKVVESGTYQGRPVIKVQCVMESVGLVKSLTKYKETEEMVLDLEGLFPWVIRNENSDKDGVEIEEVTFDYQNSLAVRVFSENDGPKEEDEVKVPGYVQDVLSLQFFLRKNISQGDNRIYFYSGGKIKEINYQVTLVSEPLKLECGEFKKHYRIYNPENNITILLADTPERYPLVIQKIGKIGKIEATLISIK